jgi:AcrR family transcriptional regulator
MAVGSRTKNQLARREQAQLTQARIIEAATKLFIRDGFLSTTVSAIAAEAGVAVQTLYSSFGNKTSILIAAFALAVAGDASPVPLRDRDWVRQILAEPDGRPALAIFAAQTEAIVDRTTPLYIVIRSAAADPEVADFLAVNKSERHSIFSVITKALSTKSGFNSALSTRQATDLLYTVLSEDTYAMLVHEHRWTGQQWREWAVRAIEAELFSPR